MARKSLGVLLVFSWIFLSGFDLLEDLKFETGTSGYSHGATTKSLPSHLKHRAGLANNIIESAASPQLLYPSTLRLTPSPSLVHSVLSSHYIVFELHKLNRVFLI